MHFLQVRLGRRLAGHLKYFWKGTVWSGTRVVTSIWHRPQSHHSGTTEIMATRQVQSSRLPLANANWTMSSASSSSACNPALGAARTASGRKNEASSFLAHMILHNSWPLMTSQTPSVAHISTARRPMEEPPRPRSALRTSGTMEMTPGFVVILTSKSPKVLEGSSPSTRPSMTLPPAASILFCSIGQLALWSRDSQVIASAFNTPDVGASNVTRAVLQSPKLAHHTRPPAMVQLLTHVPAVACTFFNLTSISAKASIYAWPMGKPSLTRRATAPGSSFATRSEAESVSWPSRTPTMWNGISPRESCDAIHRSSFSCRAPQFFAVWVATSTEHLGALWPSRSCWGPDGLVAGSTAASTSGMGAGRAARRPTNLETIRLAWKPRRDAVGPEKDAGLMCSHFNLPRRQFSVWGLSNDVALVQKHWNHWTCFDFQPVAITWLWPMRLETLRLIVDEWKSSRKVVVFWQGRTCS